MTEVYRQRESKRLYYIIEETDAGLTLERYLRQKLHFSRAQISRLKFLPDGLCVGGEKVRVNRVLQAGEELAIRLEAAERQSGHLVPTEGRLEILYEDADLIAVWKESGLVVHPSPGHYEDTLTNQLHAYYLSKQETAAVRSIGRLDRDTSGIVVFAKNQIAAARLWQQKEEGRFWKEYLAVCQGNPAQTHCAADDAGSDRAKKDADWYTINAPIGPKEGTLMQMCVRKDGLRAVTHYQILQQAGDRTAVRVRIDTGRTHQIRVHMASIGAPLAGDCLYGARNREQKASTAKLQLFAWKCQLEQPFTGKVIVIERAVPPACEGLTECKD